MRGRGRGWPATLLHSVATWVAVQWHRDALVGIKGPLPVMLVKLVCQYALLVDNLWALCRIGAGVVWDVRRARRLPQGMAGALSMRWAL
jgi:hypothetical protein